MSYGDKRDYPKINIYTRHWDWEYNCSTTWAKSIKEAKRIFAEKHGISEDSIQASFD